MDIYLIKTGNGVLIPATQEDTEKLAKIKQGQAIKVKYSIPRNYQFHRKFFALIQVAFDHWEPDKSKLIEYRGQVPIISIESFRKDLIILAGFYDRYFRADNSVRVEAKSISFSSMTQEDFEKLFSNTIDVCLKRFCTNYTEDQLRSEVEKIDRIMQFT